MNEHRIIIQEKQELEKALKIEKELVEALSKVNEIETDFTQYSFWINYIQINFIILINKNHSN